MKNMKILAIIGPIILAQFLYWVEKRKIKEQMKIILAQYFEIFSQISSSGKIYNKNIMKLQEFEIPLGV